jgi:hypothetical protein
MRRALVTCVLGLSACVMSSTSDGDRSLSEADPPATDAEPTEPGEPPAADRDECKVEDGEVGVDDLAVPTPAGEVRIVSWRTKDGEPGEYVGFTLSRRARFTVKAGLDVWTDEGTTWTHPYGYDGPDVNAISHIDFCDDDCEDEDGGDGDGGDDGVD